MSFDLPHGKAIETLRKAALQGEIQILFSDSVVDGVTTNAVQGRYVPREALALMLEGTGLGITQANTNGAYAITVIDRAPEISDGSDVTSFNQLDPDNKTDTTMSTTNNKWFRTLVAALTVGVGGVQGQEDEQLEDVYNLSPFTVESSEEVGYLATSTLAGTRINTKLSDLPNSITVATQEFMEDLNVNDATNLLPFLGNIETSGIDGTFSGGNTGASAVTLEGINRNPENNNRIRGLASADNSRLYMPTSIQFDSYNTERVTVNRGPNSILFGLGSPGGIVDSTVISPSLLNKTKFEVTVGSFDSQRLNFDIDRVLIEDKLGIRVAGLMDRTEWRQSFTYEDDDRLTIAALFKPFENANLKATYESGKIDARRPRPNAPRHALLWWWDPAFNQVTHNPFTDEFGTIDRDIVRAPGNWFYQPAVVYENPGQPGSRVHYAWEDTQRDGARFRAYTVGLTKGDQWYPSPTAASTGIEFGSFYLDEEIVDRSVFDWVENLLDGPNKFEKEEFDVLNL
ncbi:MAG: TonB-dependent receptor, partial [Verrucomicrobiae bacterium]|nr:TonB-dependent receptor [Verrucomicrobiae bacterium]